MANKKQRQHQSGNPARRAAGKPPASQEAPSLNALERFSLPILQRLHSLPRLILPLVMGLLMAGGLFLEGDWQWLGALLLGLVTLIVLWLYALSWPALPVGGRIARGIVVLGLAAIAVAKALGRL